jgi:hypothetical protein
MHRRLIMKLPVKASETDTNPELVGKQLKPGRNKLQAGSKSGMKLIVTAIEGELLTYRIVAATGKAVPETLRLSATDKKKTTCWECGKDAEGNTHCWKVPCPVIVGPWKPGKVIKAF